MKPYFKENAKFVPERKFIPPNLRGVNQIKNAVFDSSKFTNSSEDRKSIYCCGHGATNIIESKCRIYNPTRQKNGALPPTFNNMNIYSSSAESYPSSITEISICGSRVAVCTNTGATHSVVGEKLYHLLKENGIIP